MTDYCPELKKALRKAGCHFLRHGKGDHEVWFSPIIHRPFTVDSKILSRHTANGTLKDAGLPKQF